jgi:hypothetical protein
MDSVVRRILDMISKKFFGRIRCCAARKNAFGSVKESGIQDVSTEDWSWSLSVTLATLWHIS